MASPHGVSSLWEPRGAGGEPLSIYKMFQGPQTPGAGNQIPLNRMGIQETPHMRTTAINEGRAAGIPLTSWPQPPSTQTPENTILGRGQGSQQRVTSDWQQQNPLINFTGGGGQIRMPMPQGGWGGSSIDPMYPMLPNRGILGSMTGFGEQMTGFGETLGGYGEKIGGFGEQLGGFGDRLGGLEEKLGGYGGQFEGVNTKLQELTQGIATLNDKLAGMHQPQQSQQPSYGGSPFGSPFGAYGGGFNPYGGLGGMFLLGGY